MTATGIVIVVLLIFALAMITPAETRPTVIDDASAEQITERLPSRMAR